MGLDTSHDAWHGGYGRFMSWRQAVAAAAGIPNLMLMEAFWHSGTQPANLVQYLEPKWVREAFERDIFAALPLRWSALKPDPLHALLHHSDCDGEIAPEDCAAVAVRLRELLPLMGEWTERTEQFAKGCEAAAAANEPLDFH